MSNLNRNKYNFIFLIASVVLSLLILLPTFLPLLAPDAKLPSWWQSKKIKLGLDLRGGTYIVFGVQTKEAVKAQLAGMAAALRSDLGKQRVGVLKAKPNAERGLSVSLISQKGVQAVDDYVREHFRDLQKLENVEDGERVTLQYELPELKAREIEKEAVDQAIETIRNRVDQFGVAEPVIQRSGEKQIIVQLPDVKDIEGVKKTIGSVAKLEFRFVADPSKPEVETVPLKSKEGGTLLVDDEVSMSGSAIRTATVELSPTTNEIEVLLQLNSAGSEIFERLTGDNIGRRLAIVLDGQVHSAPTIRSRISGGTAQITGGFTMDDARRLAIVLRSGALPAPLSFEAQQTVGASLGADSIKSGLWASLIGSIIVVLFMIYYYRRCGYLAVICLAVNIIWLLALLALMGSTLTLPGIAGLALTVGMAVDSNIIIFERIRDELRAGKGPRSAIDAGFDRAHWTILDANITTLISGIILYAFGTGPIKGFAVTLSIGIITTVAAALFASRVCFEVMKLNDREGKLSI